MELSACFEAYLRDPMDQALRPRLSARLAERGYELEASLLERERGPGPQRVAAPGSPWDGRRAFVGARPPADAGAGDLWLDSTELTPMLLVPRTAEALEEIPAALLPTMTPFVGFLALRAVAGWQYRAFLRVARVAPRPVQVRPPLPLLDPGRILRGAETDPVTDLTHGEARLYAWFFSKNLASREALAAAAQALPAAAYQELWGTPGREWVSDRPANDEGARVAVGPEQLEEDLADAYDREDAGAAGSGRMFYGEWSHPPRVGFRTFVSSQLGLFRSVTPEPSSGEDVQLLAAQPRG